MIFKLFCGVALVLFALASLAGAWLLSAGGPDSQAAATFIVTIGMWASLGIAGIGALLQLPFWLLRG